MPKKGKLIVIDGADGSGKATQTKLLVAHLKKEGYRVATIDFPQYENNFFGAFVGECLTGKHGDFLSLNPYVASIIYDCDRWESRDVLFGFLKKGYVVVLDRYVSANQIHQGSKIPKKKERQRFLRWLEKMDHEVFGLPRPDLTLYLDVPFAKSQKLLQQKGGRLKKAYLKKGKKDQAEGNIQHQELSRKYALELLDLQKPFLQVNCVEKQELLPREVIHDRVWKVVTKYL